MTQVAQFHELDQRWYVRGNAGYNTLSSAQDYAFASLAVGLRTGRTNTELALDWNDLGGDYRFRDPVSSNRLRLTWSHRIR